MSAHFWNIGEAIELCIKIESLCPEFGCHVALTGGTLYKEGDRKDCDLLFYRIRQVAEINLDGLFNCLDSIGVVKKSGFGWCYKAVFNGKNVDMFFPECKCGDYERYDPNDLTHLSIANDMNLDNLLSI